MTYEYTEQNYRTDIAKLTPSQAGYEYVVRMGENNGWSSDAIRKIIDEVWAGRDWVEEPRLVGSGELELDDLYEGNVDVLVDCFSTADLEAMLVRAEKEAAFFHQVDPGLDQWKNESKIRGRVDAYVARLKWAINKQAYL